MMLKMERAKEEDLDLVMDLVNVAYLVEKGSTGLAFKASDRFQIPGTTVALHLRL